MTVTPSTSHRANRHARRGFTFLEAVLGTALLGILGGAIFSVFGYAWRVEIEARHTLAAAEIANRVLISYIDDPTSPEDLPELIAYEQARYRWSIDTDPTIIRDAHPDARVNRDGSPEVQQALESMERVTITAWLDDGTPESVAPGRTPTFQLERVINPFQYRGNDTLERLLNDPDRLNQMTEQLLNVTGTGL
ncbi:MAG: type II secretion system protein [Planctomycetota bacterium]